MGISPAPPWATIFYALHEQHFLPLWSQHVVYYKLFIDDVLGIWSPHCCPTHNAELWNNFKSCMQNCHSLEWVFTSPSLTCNFMDLTLSLTNNRVHTIIYEKKHNLYLYFPPHSAHPSGTINGFIFGHILRLLCLCLNCHDSQRKSQEFFHHLTEHGHSLTTLAPLFCSAHNKAIFYLAQQHQPSDVQPYPSQTKTFLHLPYHPQDPT